MGCYFIELSSFHSHLESWELGTCAAGVGLSEALFPKTIGSDAYGIRPKAKRTIIRPCALCLAPYAFNDSMHEPETQASKNTIIFDKFYKFRGI